ncbi:zinc-dependent alcohol dehydrogenase [Pectinatus haikarae]|uniref:2-desacetyl-2-hydroxyethyl bacteriochlorophyllide A dehydrogenase n=1 Tax=Pectinatus haikarae TaxID=349096 RepID=A0ABT9Y950_9FIRM|nr:alcohol dehydrogenase catalytic domain-containing protein [Pectinatus haikarae]MDQ0204046.1 2-desacetyl-2-hydroxyethyl bacteriochlorophyllide A dehydrogenase [Pectinatus haikarae]
MKAIVYEGPKKVSVKNVDIPKTKDGEVLIKVSYAGICGTDLNIFAGTHPRAKAPLIPGHEFSGVVVSDGKKYKKGDRVAAYPLISCGHCEPCKTGNAHVCDHLGLLGIDCSGAMAEYISVDEEKLVELPDTISDEMGAFVEPVAVTVHALRENSFKSGDNAIVFGCGTIGLATALTLRNFGAGKIILVETDESRAKIAREMHFKVINPINENMQDLSKDVTDGVGFDWVFDCAGVQAVASALFDSVKVKGHIVIIAAYKKPASLSLIMGMFKETCILFTRVYRYKDFAIATDLVQKEKDYGKIITHKLPLEDGAKGFELLTTPMSGAVKVMYKIS